MSCKIAAYDYLSHFSEFDPRGISVHFVFSYGNMWWNKWLQYRETVLLEEQNVPFVNRDDACHYGQLIQYLPTDQFDSRGIDTVSVGEMSPYGVITIVYDDDRILHDGRMIKVKQEPPAPDDIIFVYKRRTEGVIAIFYNKRQIDLNLASKQDVKVGSKKVNFSIVVRIYYTSVHTICARVKLSENSTYEDLNMYTLVEK